MLERDSDLASLTDAWRSTAEVGGRLVLVSGEAGAGKSTLVRAFVDGLAPGTPVLYGACDPLSTPRPLGPLHDMAEDLNPGAAALLRDGAASHDIFVAVVDDLRLRSLVLVVDDLHWSDQGTVDLLRFLLRRLASTRSMVVVTVRDDEVGADHPLRALLGDVARAENALSLALQPLSSAAIRTLVADRPLDVERLHELTGGNPFFVGEMLGHEGDELPSTVRDAILARAAGLDEDARTVLDLLACAPEAVPDRLLPELGIGLPALRALADAGLVRRTRRRGVALRHDLCRLAVLSAIPPGGETALHQRMLTALERSPLTVDPAVLAHHARGAGDDERVVRHAAAAGRQSARSGAHHQSAEFFRTALEHGPPPEPRDEAELLELLAYEEHLLDRLDAAVQRCEQARALRERIGDKAGVSADYVSLAIFEWYRGNRQAAERHATAAVAALPEDDPASESPVLGHAHSVLGYLAMQASDIEVARSERTRAEAVAGQVDDGSLVARNRLLDASIRLLEGDAAGRHAILAVVEPALGRFDDIHSSGFSNLAYLDVDQRRLPEAAALLDVSLPLTVEWDLPICNVWQLGARGRLGLLRGDWQQATDDADLVLDRPGSAPFARTWPHLIRALVALRRSGDAGDDLDQAWDWAVRLAEPMRLLPAAAALVERSWLLGGHAGLDEAAAMLQQHHGPGLEWVRGDLAVWLRRAGVAVPDTAAEVAAPYRLQLDGEHLAAAERWAALNSPYEQALALVDSGDVEAVRTALDVLDRLGADAVASKVRQDLRLSGVAVVPGRRRASTRENPHGLTARQVDVLRLLDEGLTNEQLARRLYISPKTADHHVSAILAKLQVPSRQQAVLAGRELGLLG
jgi:ATP/maltotriose-dependent transcriptional regulator MalT